MGQFKAKILVKHGENLYIQLFSQKTAHLLVEGDWYDPRSHAFKTCTLLYSLTQVKLIFLVKCTKKMW